MIKVEIIAAGDAFGKGAGGAGDVFHYGFGLHRQAVQNLQVRAQEFNAHRGLDAGGEHVDADLDGIAPGVGEPRKFHRRIHLPDEGLSGQARTPVFPVLEADRGLDHGQRRRVGGGIGPAGFPEDVLHLGKGADDAVGLLEDIFRLGDGDARHGGGHIEQVAFIQGRHELGPQMHQGIDGDRHGQSKARAMASLGKRMIPRKTGRYTTMVARATGFFSSGMILPRIKYSMRMGTRVMARMADPPMAKVLVKARGRNRRPVSPVQGENGQKGDRDHQNGEKERGAHFLGGLQDQGLPGGIRRGVLDVLVGVFHHHHRGVHHGADGDGNPRQAQDVGIDVELVLQNQGDQHPERQADDGHDGAAHVQKKDEADQGDNDNLLGDGPL